MTKTAMSPEEILEEYYKTHPTEKQPIEAPEESIKKTFEPEKHESETIDLEKLKVAVDEALNTLAKVKLLLAQIVVLPDEEQNK